MGETMLGACYGQGGTTTRNIMVHVSGMSQRLLNFWGLRGAILNQSMRRKEGAREGNLHILTRCQFLDSPQPIRTPPLRSSSIAILHLLLNTSEGMQMGVTNECQE